MITVSYPNGARTYSIDTVDLFFFDDRGVNAFLLLKTKLDWGDDLDAVWRFIFTDHTTPLQDQPILKVLQHRLLVQHFIDPNIMSVFINPELVRSPDMRLLADQLPTLSVSEIYTQTSQLIALRKKIHDPLLLSTAPSHVILLVEFLQAEGLLANEALIIRDLLSEATITL